MVKWFNGELIVLGKITMDDDIVKWENSDENK